MQNHTFKMLFFTLLLFFASRLSSYAVTWQSLSGTTRYKISYDEESIRLTPNGRLGIWLRFTPRSENDRKAAATEYKDKRYRSHLEYYEVDCGDMSAQLGLVDILGGAFARIKRLHGSDHLEPVLPGSVLDNAIKVICPVLDDVSEESDEIEELGGIETGANAAIDSNKSKLIEELRIKTSAKDATAETWKDLGNIYFDTNQPELAITAYQHALNMNPSDTDALNDQGAMYRQTGDFQRAVTNFEKAFSLDSKNLESLYNCGYVYAFDLGNINKALVLWRKYIELEPTGETAMQIRSFIEKYGK